MHTTPRQGSTMHQHSKTRLPAPRGRLTAFLLVVATAVTFVAVAGLLAGCGSSSNKTTTTSSGLGAVTPPPALNTNGKRGGSMTILLAGDVDSMDPGYTFYALDYEIIFATQRPLYGYKANSNTVVPDLATAMPVVSKDGKTVTVHIRSGVRFGPPVNREVTSTDVKYAIERGFAGNVANGYATSYFAVLQGAPKALAATPAKVSIPGIETPDKTTLIFHLTEPSGAFIGALVMPLTAPVPEEYAKPFDAAASSTYGQHVVATGPYMVANDASGNIKVGWSPGTFIHLIRNKNWDKSTDFRPAYLDTINYKEGVSDPTVMTRQILAGSADANGDAPPSPAELRSILNNPTQKKQLFFIPVSGSRYVALNTSKPPFDNENVRRAVAYVLDRRAMRLTRGGPIDGVIATHFIDPSYAGLGFEAGGGYSNPFASPNDAGDVAKAKAELKKAGFANGMFSGAQVTMVSDNTPPGSNTAKVVAADLAKIGFKVKNIAVLHQTMYSKFCSVPKNAPNICPNVGWLQDFKDPQTIMDVPFNGKSIAPANSSNWPQLNDPKINAEMDAAAKLTDVKARAEAWGKIDKEVTLTAAAVPWVWENFPTLFSSKVVPQLQTWNEGAPDVSWISVK
jgi:peptide/nickel transport system substrate-binding protein